MDTPTKSLTTVEKSIRIVELLEKGGQMPLAEIADRLEMNSSTVHNHLLTLKKHGYVTVTDDGYQLGGAVFDLGQSESQFEIIEILRDIDSGEVTAIADELGTNTAAARRQLDRLEEIGYVIRDGDEYEVSLKFLDVGGYKRDNMELYRAGKAKIDELAEKTGELVNLVTTENGLGVYLYQRTGERGHDLDTYLGMRSYLHQTAAGKAILSALPDERVEEIIDRHGLPGSTDATISDPEELFDELQSIRDRGVAFDDEERLSGLRCASAPIQTEAGELIGAISISAPISRMEGDRFTEDIPNQIRNAVNLIELDINYAD